MEVKKVKLSALRLNPNNPRIIRDEKFKKLVKSILTFPKMLELREIVTDETMMVLGGNMRFRALQEIASMTENEIKSRLKQYGREDLTDYWMTWHDCPMDSVKIGIGLTDAEKAEFIDKDNLAYGEWDWDSLANQYDIEVLQDWGHDVPIDWGNDAESNEMEKEAEEDDFDEEKDAVEPICQRGDIWMLGQHTLMCGDSTSEEDVKKLMNGEKADMVFTDPPYGISIVGGSKSFGKVGGSNIVEAKTYSNIIGDDSTETAKLNYNIVKELSKNQIIFGGNYFTDFLPPKPCWCIWDKENTGNFADVEMAWTSFSKSAKLYKWLWNGLCRKGERSVEGKSRVHPTQKPVGLIGEIFKDFTKENEIVLDPFGGSGSTLIACEQLDRKCYMMELDPHYCDVIIARWEKLTGNKAIKKQ